MSEVSELLSAFGEGDPHASQQLLPLVDYVKMDMRTVDPQVLASLAPRFKQEQKKLVAEKVESRNSASALSAIESDGRAIQLR